MKTVRLWRRLYTYFVHNALFNIENYLTDRFAKNLAKAEDKNFVFGTGEYVTTDVLEDIAGAKTGTTTFELCVDDILRLYFRSIRNIVKTPYG